MRSIENFFDLVNMENTYGPYCNPNNKFTPDAGIIRYAGFVRNSAVSIENVVFFLSFSRTPWLGKCVLNLQSCCLPTFPNGTLIPNLAISTTFYLHLVIPPLCSSENITIHTGSGQTVIRSFVVLLEREIFLLLFSSTLIVTRRMVLNII